MTDFKNDNITYKGLEDKGLTVVLTDENGGKWTIWKKAYQSEEDSEAYSALQNYKFGETFGVSYGEKEESFTNKENKLVKFTRKTIYSILPPINKPIEAYGVVGENKADIEDQPDNYWDKKALKQCLWNYWLEKVAKPNMADWMGEVDAVFHDIEKYADKRFSPGWAKAQAQFKEELPTIQQDDESWPTEEYQ